MKKIAFYFNIFSLLFFLSACSSSRPANGNKNFPEHTIIQVDHPVSLTNLLLQAPGVLVEEGINPRVFIRGRQPLFVLDGMQVGFNYGDILRMVDINTVAAVEILRNPSETFMYGRNGSNGVIVIHTGEYNMEN